ncbi:MAG: lytic murein transglycosylase [Desulfovibrionaceae bacterium]|nr:lytic murein transglycosylase [Desulfovibrionaceae bacterium]
MAKSLFCWNRRLAQCGLFLCMCLYAGLCAAEEAKPSAAAPATEAAEGAVTAAMPTEPAPVWQPLIKRLEAEGQNKTALTIMFAGLPDSMTQSPMGRKVLELYRSKFVLTKPDGSPAKPRPKYYPGTITEKHALLCRNFLKEYSAAFDQAEQQTGVPRNVACALLFVETRLGANVGKENALYTLASMALSTTPDSITTWLSKMEGYEAHLDWMKDLMPKRAEWAYKELRALTAHAIKQNIDPRIMPGSIYGAVGMCQFMPSNIEPYGADGDNDGIIDLYNPADAIASLSNYLHTFGWKAGIDEATQHAVLKKYNKSDTYANTILGLAAVIGGAPVPDDAN